MDPNDALSATFFKWDPRAVATATAAAAPPAPPHHHLHPADLAAELERPRDLGEVFHGYGVRAVTAVRIGDMGFTASTLAGMRDDELDDMMATLAHVFRCDLLVGERYGIKAAVRSERRRLESLLSLLHHHHHHHDAARRRLLLLPPNHLDAISQEGLSEEREAAGSGGEPARKGKQRRGGKSKRKKTKTDEDDDGWGEEEDSSETESGGGGPAAGERQREHPFIVTEPGEVARAKKNGLDYLFHLYEQCREFLLQVQSLAKERGQKCPTKVTNQVFRYAKRTGASYINKPKMRHYVHCYALHCLDEEGSNELRRAFKERGENVGAWRQACYKPLVAMSANHGYDIDALFNAHPRLSIWYVPTKLRQMCHVARSGGGAATSAAGGLPPPPPPMF
uniref:Floricaula/leafy-like transcription factor n=2 Tax=Alstroemeria TaxID=56741 RepID=H7C8K7_ALSLI|nr:floricaula/leafy protein [Alstroemeria ligtu subsp. ligtu]BAL70390.1 floricaula/leafy protein [Alstroemeria hybrid cultivar]